MLHKTAHNLYIKQNRHNRVTRLADSRYTGFTLVEILVALLVLGVLFSIAIPSFAALQRSTTEQTVTQNINQTLQNAELIATGAGRNIINRTDLETSRNETAEAQTHGTVTELQDATTLIEAANNGTLEGTAPDIATQIALLTHGAVIYFQLGNSPKTCGAIIMSLNNSFETGEADGTIITIKGTQHANFGDCA